MAKEELGEVDEPQEFTVLPGMGLKAKYDDRVIIMGNRTLMHELNLAVEHIEEELNQLEQNGKTAIMLAVNGKIEAIIALSDQVRAHAASHINP